MQRPKTNASALLIACALSLQAAQPEFEVASIKSQGASDNEPVMKTTPDGINYSNVRIIKCIQAAYHVFGFQVSYPPTLKDLVDSEAYDIVAKAGHPAARPELMAMLQSLLAGRFHLQFHRETKEVPVYFLVTGKKALKLETAQGEGESLFRLGPGTAVFTHMPISGLVDFLYGLGPIQRPVIDRTALSGIYNFTLTLSDTHDDPTKPVVKTSSFSWPSIFADVQNIGLKLDPGKAPVEILVIDRAERPSGN